MRAAPRGVIVPVCEAQGAPPLYRTVFSANCVPGPDGGAGAQSDRETGSLPCGDVLEPNCPDSQASRAASSPTPPPGSLPY